MKRRVVITGMGTVNPLANNVQDSWQAAKEGKCGIGFITQYDTANQKLKIAGEVKINPEDYLDKKEARRMDRFTQLAMIAAKEAMEDCQIDWANTDTSRTGVIFSSGIGGLSTIENEHNRGLERGFDKVSPFFIPMSIVNMAAGQIAIAYGLKGMCTAVVTACASSTNAIGDAFHYVRDGYAEVMVAGGAEGCVTPLAIGGFTAMKALAVTEDLNRASIPFDKERHGFVLGEGAGALVLEEYEHALARGAKIYGEIIGYGATCDAYHMTAPQPDGEGAANAMRMAVNDGQISLEQVDYINAHGTSTPLNDKGEIAAIKKVFGEKAKDLLISSTKSMTGHLLGASGAMEAIFTVLSLKEGFVLPTINYQVPDEECDLDIVPNEGRKKDIKYALSNSLGFGGHNGTLLFKRFEEE